MFFLNFTINEIHKMPITIYYKLIEQCFNLGNMTSGGGYKMSSDAESKEFKTMQAFREIQERKRLGKW